MHVKNVEEMLFESKWWGKWEYKNSGQVTKGGFEGSRLWHRRNLLDPDGEDRMVVRRIVASEVSKHARSRDDSGCPDSVQSRLGMAECVCI